MLTPKRTKYRRPHRVSFEGHAKGGTELAFGDFGLVAKEGAWVTARQLEAARVAITRYLDRTGKVWIKVFPHLAKTKKPLEVRMGSGKGNVEGYVAVVKEGVILFEITGCTEEQAKEAFRLGGAKLPVLSKMVKREDK